jgi:WD40 repeat protein
MLASTSRGVHRPQSVVMTPSSSGAANLHVSHCDCAALHAVTRPAAAADEGYDLREAWTASVGNYATALSVSHDGGLLAIGTGGGMLFVFDAKSGALRFQVSAHAGGVLSLDWSPRTRVLATAGQDGCARLYDARGEQLAELRGSAAWVEHVAWAPDGEKLATASGRVVCIWTASGALAWKTDAHESTVTGVAWNRRSTEFVTACHGGAQLFRVGPESKTRRFPWRGSLISLAWSPSGAVLACGTQERSVHFWRLSTGQDSEISGFPSKPRALAWDAGGELLATSGDTTVNVWRFDEKGPEGRPSIPLVGHDAVCTALAFHPNDALLASGADDMQVLLWDPRKTSSPVGSASLDETVTGLAWALGGNRLIGVDAVGTARAWCVE